MSESESNSPTIDLSTLPKGQLNLVGLDGNAFSIVGAVSRALKSAGWTSQQVSEYVNQARSGDYNHLLAVSCSVVESPEEEDDCDEDGDGYDDDYDYDYDPDQDDYEDEDDCDEDD